MKMKKVSLELENSILTLAEKVYSSRKISEKVPYSTFNNKKRNINQPKNRSGRPRALSDGRLMERSS